VYVPPFEQLIKRGANQLEENISKGSHDYFFSSITFDLPFDMH
jgi:hypothetical protein